MGFEIVGASDEIEKVWLPVKNTDTLYVGQIVRCNNEGAEPLAVASGVGDEANHMVAVGSIADGASANNVPYGIVIGTNLTTPVFDSTYKTQSITYLAPASATYATYMGVEGVWARGDKIAMVEVAIIDSTTRIRGPIHKAAYGTAITVGTVTTGGTVSSTTNAVDVAGVASLSTIYFRSGAVAGQYRITDDTSTTAHAWDLPVDGTVAVGDTLVKVNLRPQGLSRMYIDAEAQYIDASAAVTANYLFVNMLKLDLSVAGSEYAEFRFNPQQFIAVDDIA